MRTSYRLVVATTSSALVGAAAAALLLHPGLLNPYGVVSTLLAVGLWLTTITLYARGIARRNPSHIVVTLLLAVSMSLAAVVLVTRPSLGWSGLWSYMALNVLLLIALCAFAVRAVSTKYANRRAAHGR
jgi:hypothetical protein